MQTNKLKAVFILVKCTRDGAHDCRDIRDMLISSIPNIQESYTTNTTIEGITWCVTASALVPTVLSDEFMTKIRNLKTPEGIGLEKNLIIFDER